MKAGAVAHYAGCLVAGAIAYQLISRGLYIYGVLAAIIPLVSYSGGVSVGRSSTRTNSISRQSSDEKS